MGFWKKFLDTMKDESKDNYDLIEKKDATFVTEDEENMFENSMYGKVQMYKAGVAYIEEVFPTEGHDLRRQIDLIITLLEQTNREDDPEIIEVFNILEEQYAKMKRLADGEYTIRQLEQQNVDMDKRFESAGFTEKPLTDKELYNFQNYIDLIQNKVGQSDQNDEYPLFTKVQRQRFNSISFKAEYRLKMLKLMKLMKDARSDHSIEENSINNPFRNLSPLKQRMYSNYFLEDARSITQQYDGASVHEKLYNQIYYNAFKRLDTMAEKLREDMVNASMLADFSMQELFDSENQKINSFEFLKRFAVFKSELNDAIETIPRLVEKERKKGEEEAERVAKMEAEKLAKEAEEEKYRNMTSDDIEQEIYRIEHDLSATGNRFVNILDFQKEVARKKGLLDTESEVQRDDLTYKVVDAAELEILLGQLDEAGTNYIVFPDSQEAEKSGFLVIVSDSDSDKLRNSSPQISYSNLGSNYSVDEKLGSYPSSILNMLCEKLISKYGKDFKNSLSITKRENDLYDLAYVWYAYENRPRGYKEDKDNIRNMLFDIKQEFESEIGSESKLKDILCYIEFRANENIIPMLEKMKNAGIAAFIEPISDKKRNEKNRNNIRIYFRREDLSKYLETVDEEILSEHRHIPVRWGEDASIKKVLARESSWPDEKVRS